jgi:signal transduction histidine kinase
MAQRLADEDERRRKLLADIGHELRTPMTVIRGQIEAVIDGLHPPERLADVLDEVDLMDRLLDDLRVLALAEAGRLELQIESVDLTQLVTDVLDSFDARANAQGVSLAMERESEIDEIAADPYRLHQVFSNLVSNALDQMPDGGSVQVRMAAWPDRVTVSIRDSGPGIDDDSLERIFQRFEKAGDSKGTGLGLSISRDLVEAHGGTLTAGNHPEGGAAFIVELPRQIASPP